MKFAEAFSVGALVTLSIVLALLFTMVVFYISKCVSYAYVWDQDPTKEAIANFPGRGALLYSCAMLFNCVAIFAFVWQLFVAYVRDVAQYAQ